MGQDLSSDITSTEANLPYNPQNTMYNGEGNGMMFKSGSSKFDSQSHSSSNDV